MSSNADLTYYAVKNTIIAEMGADHFLDKSCDYDQLCDALDELAARRFIS